ncbi:hypothetical protein [Pantoea stewartii]|uniref:hypothetical protein n=1 Tax=Pantoea stewartii TaxID=66269 RepID=UPI001627E74B|nr:hypothetical protein [Pantoea stewartii]MBC0853841.1 hypothetical protein [Pantoea stewartii]
MSVAKLKEQDDLVADVKAILTLLKEREWAEHCTKSRPGRELESLITDMHNEIAELQEKLEAAENLANFRGEMVKDCLRKSMPENIAAIIDSGDLEAICYGHEYPGAENHRMALFNFRMARRSGTHETADKAGE